MQAQVAKDSPAPVPPSPLHGTFSGSIERPHGQDEAKSPLLWMILELSPQSQAGSDAYTPDTQAVGKL